MLNDSGKTVEIDCRYSVFDPIPTIKVNGRPIDLAPPLGAFVKLWIALPIGLAFMGGAIGGLFGAIATLTNARIFRLSGNTSSKFLSSAGVSITAAILWWEVSSRLSEVIRRYFAAAA